MPTFEIATVGSVRRVGMRSFLRHLCVGAALGLSVAAAGCDNNYSPGPENGGSKGPEIRLTGETGQPASGSASSMSQSTAPPGYMPNTRIGPVDAGTD
jgi:hypothetical protein